MKELRLFHLLEGGEKNDPESHCTILFQKRVDYPYGDGCAMNLGSLVNSVYLYCVVISLT